MFDQVTRDTVFRFRRFVLLLYFTAFVHNAQSSEVGLGAGALAVAPSSSTTLHGHTHITYVLQKIPLRVRRASVLTVHA